jgi:hypothetical protein
MDSGLDFSELVKGVIGSDWEEMTRLNSKLWMCR